MILESYKDCFDIRIKKDTYEKLKDIIYWEEDKKGNKQINDNIEDSIKKIEEKSYIDEITIEKLKTGYEIHYKIDGYRYVVSCYTLSEVVINLKMLYRKWC